MGRGPPPPFAVEEWMDTHETTAKYDLGETSVHPLSIDELVSLSDNKEAKISDVVDTAAEQHYGEIRGSKALRDNLSRLYSSKTGTPLPPDNILITPGGIAANHLVFYGLLKEGDHVVCQYPVYQQLYSVPESLGAEVSLWKCRAEKKWIPEFEELEGLVREDTKMIILNNPINPTGAILPKPLLFKIIELAETKNITLLCDEVYRPLFHSITPMSGDFPPSILSLGYTNTIAVGSLSKAYSLAGIRTGWIASRSSALIESCAAARHYTTISVSLLDQAVAAFALSPETVHGLLGRNIGVARANLELLDRFVIKHDEYCSWVKPLAGTTAFVRFARDEKAVHAKALCQKVFDDTGLLLMPGDVGFGAEFEGYVRFGFCNKTEVVKEALEVLRKWMRKEFDDVPLAEEVGGEEVKE